MDIEELKNEVAKLNEMRKFWLKAYDAFMPHKQAYDKIHDEYSDFNIEVFNKADDAGFHLKFNKNTLQFEVKKK